MEDIATNYSDVLRGASEQVLTAENIIALLKQSDRFYSIAEIIEATQDEFQSNHAFIRSACKGLSKGEILEEKGFGLDVSYRLKTVHEATIKEQIDKIFGEDTSNVPETVKEYYKNFGFIELVKAVSKQINHEDICIRQFDEDRLWLGRYIDFLEKAREYVAWQKADQAIAQKKISELRKQHQQKQ